MHTPNINYTLKHDLCTGCGLCSGGCSLGAISTVVKNGRFLPTIDESKCRNFKGCHRCYDVCPGVGVNLVQCATESKYSDSLIGQFHSCYVGYSSDNDLRYHAASGGATSQFLIWLLENDKIDGVVVSKFDKGYSLKVKSFIARTKDEILAAKSSKYAPVSFHEAVIELKEAPNGRYVVVGLPCHIHGFRKLEKIDKKIASKIVGHFAIFCSASRTFYFTEYLMKERGIKLSDVDYLAYRDRGNLGGLVVQGKDIDYYQDYRKYCHPLRSIFNPRRCLLCIDHYGELADISFGDINIPPYNNNKIGINSIIVRDGQWNSLLMEAKQSGCIHLEEVESAEINKSQPSAKMKKGRNMRFVYMLSKFGFVTPEYDTKVNKYGKNDILKYIINRLLQFVGRHKSLWPFIKITKK